MKVIVIVFILSVLATANAFNLRPLLRPEFANSRIIAGKEAEPGEAPYIVSLKISQHFCAGTIIDKHWVLTAGHCVTSRSFTVVAGLHNRTDESQVQIRNVNRTRHTIVHERYDHGVGPNDIALIYIETPFNFTELRADGKPLVAKVDLPSNQFSQIGDGTLYGWGRDESYLLPNVLKKLDTTIITYEHCKQHLPFDAPIAPVNICSYDGTVASACNGDSGGPLVKKNGKSVEQIGIVSWGYTPCATTDYPSVYTHTHKYDKWIRDSQKKFTLN